MRIAVCHRVAMCRRALPVIMGCGLLVVTAAEPATAQPATAQPAAAESAKPAVPAVHKVRSERMKIEVTLKGVLEAAEMSEVGIRLEEPGTSLTVKKAVEHGATVKKGDTLIWLDLEKIDRAIRDLEGDNRLADLAIRLAEEELPILEKTTPLDLVAAERAKQRSDEDLKKWIDVDRGFMEKQAEQSLKQSRQSLEYQKEELKQLEKMYKANDLTEETEEIILKRQRNQVESSEFYLKIAEMSRERTLKIDIPRRDQDVREAAAKQALALDRSKATLPLALNQKKLALDKLKYDRGKTTERLANLKQDREAMTIKAPADGVVYYGKFTRGTWSGSAASAAKLQRGGSILNEEVVLTIVQPQDLFVRATVEEADVHHFRPGLSAKVALTARPDLKLTAKVTSVSGVPISPGSFEVQLALEPRAGESAALLPSLACAARFVPYLNEKALTVPVASLVDDELSDDARYVYVVGKDRKPEKRTVTVGKKNDKKAEILTGLREGDEVLLEKPSDGSLAAAAPKAAAATPKNAAPAAGKDGAR